MIEGIRDADTRLSFTIRREQIIDSWQKNIGTYRAIAAYYLQRYLAPDHPKKGIFCA